MARPQKKGLDYFPVDVDMCSDDKIYMLEVECGLEGLALFMKLLMKVYDHSYYLKWRDKDVKIFAHKNSVGVNVVNNLIQVCLDNDLFDADIYKEFGILTSKAIQERYFKAVVRRKEVKYRPELMLVDVNEYNNLVNVNINLSESNSVEDNGDKSTQSKVEEIESKEDKNKSRSCSNGDDDKKTGFAEIEQAHFKATSSMITGYQKEMIESFISDGIEPEAILLAYKETGEVGANFAHTKAILNNWIKKKVFSKEEAKRAIEEHHGKSKSNKGGEGLKRFKKA